MTHSRIVFIGPVASINIRLTLLYLPHSSTLRRVQNKYMRYSRINHRKVLLPPLQTVSYGTSDRRLVTEGLKYF
jgi:hypothetical protein